jgi:hypothetical protein
MTKPEKDWDLLMQANKAMLSQRMQKSVNSNDEYNRYDDLYDDDAEYKEGMLWLECARVELNSLKEFSGILAKELNQEEFGELQKEVKEEDPLSTETINSYVNKKYEE